MENEVLAACLFTQMFTREPQCAKMEHGQGMSAPAWTSWRGEEVVGDYYSVQGQKTDIYRKGLGQVSLKFPKTKAVQARCMV